MSLATAVLLGACSSGPTLGRPMPATLQQPTAADQWIASAGSAQPRTPSEGSSVNRDADRFMDAEQTQGVLYVSGDETKTVLAYRSQKAGGSQPYCTVTLPREDFRTRQVVAMGVDDTGTLWVPLTRGSPSEVVSYARNCGYQGITLFPGTGSGANSIAFGPRGTNYVDLEGNKAGGGVAVFPKGATTPKRYLFYKAVRTGDAVGVDADGNVYEEITNTNFRRTLIVEYKEAKLPGVALAIHGLGRYGGHSITFDKSGNMIVPDGTADRVDIWTPPYSGSATSVIKLRGAPSQCSLDRKETRLACANSQTNSVDVYSYPSGSYIYSDTVPPSEFAVSGVAFDPAPPK